MMRSVINIIRKVLVAIAGLAVTFIGAVALLYVMKGPGTAASPASDLLELSPSYTCVLIGAIALWAATALLYLVSALISRIARTGNSAD